MLEERQGRTRLNKKDCAAVFFYFRSETIRSLFDQKGLLLQSFFFYFKLLKTRKKFL